MKLKSRISNLVSQRYFPVVFLLVLGLAAYGRLIIQGGVYGDDPQMLYAYHRFGLAGYWQSLGWSRPFGIWVYTPLHILFGNHPQLWHINAILLRVLSAWLLFKLLWKVKKEWHVPALWAAAACLVYPGFSQQAHALQFSLHWAALSASLASQVLMLWGLEEEKQNHQRLLLVLSWLLAALGIFSTEYFIGLEALRFIVLWVYQVDKSTACIDKFSPHSENPRRTKNTQSANQKYKVFFLQIFSRWLPYLVLVLAFSAWRAFIARISYPSPLLLKDLRANPSEALSTIFTRIPSDIRLSGFTAWKNAIMHTPYHMKSWIYIAIGVAAVSLISFAFQYFAANIRRTSIKNSVLMITIGLALTLFSGLPLWIAKIPLALSFPENRATLCLMVGVCLTLAGLASLAQKAGHILMAILLGFSLVFQFDILLVYANSWEKIQVFFHQLTTKAPGLEPGTALLYEEPFILSYPANSLSALLNWTYDAENHSEHISYDMLRISERLGSSIPALEPELPIQHGAFQGSTSKMLVVTLDEQGCPKFLFPDDPASELAASLLRQASRMSNPDVIIHEPGQPAQLPEFLQNP